MKARTKLVFAVDILPARFTFKSEEACKTFHKTISRAIAAAQRRINSVPKESELTFDGIAAELVAAPESVDITDIEADGVFLLAELSAEIGTKKAATEEETADDESTDDESTDDETADDETADDESTDDESTDDETADDESTDDESTEEDATDDESTDEDSDEDDSEVEAETETEDKPKGRKGRGKNKSTE